MVIGRNEGERLGRCIQSVVGRVDQIVYVDSGSTDGSVEAARGLGAEVVELDPATPFTAARARNVGFARLTELAPAIDAVQFVDGDCEVVEGWLETAIEALTKHPEWAVVAGRRRERFPEASVYNELCDVEWDTPVGQTLACGGDALMRADAFRAVRGFDPTVIAGEEPELCVRLIGAGWQIHRLKAEMTLHDAAIARFGQWWKRSVRAGHAYAEGAQMHGSGPSRHCVQETRRIAFWGGAVPVLCAAALPFSGASSLLLLGAYSVTAARAYRYVRQRQPVPTALRYAAFMTLAKVPEFQGVMRFHLGRVLRRPSRIVEYKRSG